jgi:indole-3-glycerol phosphate synthase
LVAARGAVGLPVLRKDFIMSEYAVAASAAMGADAVLLIVRLLEPGLLRGLYQQAENLGLECLVEIHDEADLARLEGIEPAIVGINNRDLATFETNLATAGRLAGELPAATIPVALSGIAEAADVRAAAEAGISRFLVGESLVRAPDAAVLLRSLRKALDRG